MKKMKTFIYHGPDSGATIDGVEYLFWNGKDVTLPADNGYVKTLIFLGHLTEKEAK